MFLPPRARGAGKCAVPGFFEACVLALTHPAARNNFADLSGSSLEASLHFWLRFSQQVIDGASRYGEPIGL